MYHCLGKELLPSATEISQNAVKPQTENVVDQAQIYAEKENGDNYDDSRTDDFVASRPRDLLHLAPDISIELGAALGPIFDFLNWIHRISNITAALSVRVGLLPAAVCCFVGRPGGIRTHNIRFWRPALCQLELLA